MLSLLVSRNGNVASLCDDKLLQLLGVVHAFVGKGGVCFV